MHNYRKCISFAGEKYRHPRPLKKSLNPYKVCAIFGRTQSTDWLKPNFLNQLGQDDNKDISFSWCPWDDQLRYLHGDNVWESVENDDDKTAAWKRGDIVKLIFDFKIKTVRIFHNEMERDCAELKGQKIWIGLSFHYKQSEVEMIDYQYE